MNYLQNIFYDHLECYLAIYSKSATFKPIIVYTQELAGTIREHILVRGGAIQTIVLDRNLWDDPVKLDIKDINSKGTK